MRDSSVSRSPSVVTSRTRPVERTPCRRSVSVRWSGLAASGRSVVTPRLYQARTRDGFGSEAGKCALSKWCPPVAPQADLPPDFAQARITMASASEIKSFRAIVSGNIAGA